MMTTTRKKMGTLWLLTVLLCGPQRAFACDEGQDDRAWPCRLEVRGSSVTLVGASFVWQASAWYVRTQGRSLSPMRHLAPQLYFARIGQTEYQVICDLPQSCEQRWRMVVRLPNGRAAAYQCHADESCEKL